VAAERRHEAAQEVGARRDGVVGDVRGRVHELLAVRVRGAVQLGPRAIGGAGGDERADERGVGRVRDGDRRELPRRRAHVGDQDDGDEEDKEVKLRARSRQEEKTRTTTTAVVDLGMARHWRHPEGEDDMSARGSQPLLALPRWTATAREEESGIEETGEEGEGPSGCAGFCLDFAFCFFLVGGRVAGKETRFRGIFSNISFFFFSFSFFK